MTTRTTVLDGEDTQPSRIAGNPETNGPQGEQETPAPAVERVKDDLMQDEEDTDGNV